MKDLLRLGVFLTLCLTGLGRGQCPVKCECRHGRVNCINKDLTEIPENFPSDTVEINLMFNEIEEVYKGTFNSLPHLRKLTLSNNKIFFVEEGAFDGAHNLNYLSLKSNELSVLYTDAFKGLTSLTKLDLSNNHFESLSSDIFRDLLSLRKIYLDTNPWLCDCEVSWMVGLVQQKTIYPAPICQHPPDHAGKSIMILSSRSLCREPRILTMPRNTAAKIGGSVAFECVVEGEPFPTVTWIRNDSLLVPDDVKTLLLDDGSLIINDVSADDVASYKCVAMNAVTKTLSNSAQLRVLDLTLPSKPLITKKPLDKSVVENDKVTFECGVVGHPQPLIDWTFNGRTVTTDPRFYISPSGSLVMEGLKGIDAGLYKCLATNNLGSASEFARLQVFNAPIFSTIPQNQRVVESHPAFFSCDAIAEPPATITWKKDDLDIVNSERVSINPSGTTLAINAVNRFDEGTYECRAGNLGGVAKVSAILTVVSTAPPRLSMVSSNVTTYIGNNIRLQCEVESGDPAPVVRWMRGSVPIALTTNAKYQVGHDGELVIRNLEYLDEGVYVCVAENIAGIVRNYVSVSVRDPRFSPIDDTVIGNTVTTVSRQVGVVSQQTQTEIDRIRHQPVSPHELMRNNRYPPTRAIPLARAAEVFEQTIEKLFRDVHSGINYNISYDKNATYEELLTQNQLILLSSLSGCTEHRRVVETCDDLCFHHVYRTFDGTCNNLNNPMSGASLTALKRLVPPRYENNFNLPIGWDRNKLYHGVPLPSARKVSLDLLSTKKMSLDREYTHMLMQWGQFIDHDLDFSPISVSNARFSDGRFCNETCNSQSPCFPIPVESDDPRVNNHRCIGFVRSTPMCGSGMTSPLFRDKAIHRQQVNLITSFIDASQVYGNSEEEAVSLMNHNTDQGLLRVGVQSNYNSKKRLLPPNQGEFIDCQVDPNTAHVPCFQAGDHRVNEQLGLTAVHTIWFRQHNRLAGLLKRMNSHWDGNKIYHESRKVIAAMLQHITYEHWLPKVLGPYGMQKIGRYNGYNASVDPSIANAFSTAAFRFGHTMIMPFLNRLNSEFNSIPEGNLKLHKAFFAPFRIVEEGGIDPILRGLFASPAKKSEPEEFINDELTEKLFMKAHEVALDLAAFNVQRGRDHGLHSYNAYRKLCGLRHAETFQDLAREIPSRMVRNKLKSLYGHPDNIDLYVGGVVEEPLRDARIGATFSCIIADQFKRLRDGDRFWYEKAGVFSEEQLVEIKKSTFSRIICDNSDGIMEIQKDVFRLMKNTTSLLDCYSQDIADFDVRPWSQCCQSCSRSGDFRSTRTRRSVDPMQQQALNFEEGMEGRWTIDKKRNEEGGGPLDAMEVESKLENIDTTIESLNLMIADLRNKVKSLEADQKS